MSCDHWTYSIPIFDLAPRPSPTAERCGYVSETETDLEGDLGRPELIADQSKPKRCRQETRSRITPDSTQIDPEYVWGDEGPIND
jgi:hypothetical protein